MSNPAVIFLAETRTSRGESFRIEDNIGECIHIHLGEIRIDFTIQEFLNFSAMIQESLTNLIEVDGFNLGQLDPIFLSALGDGLSDLESVKVEEISLSRLEIYTDTWLGTCLRPLRDSKMYLAMKGQTAPYCAYRQENLHGQTNLDRLSDNINTIRENGYPHKEHYIVLFNNQNIIRDGQHRASALYHLYGDHNIPILRLKFRNNRFQLSRYPWLKAMPGRLLRLPPKWLKWNYCRCRQIAGKLLRSIGPR